MARPRNPETDDVIELLARHNTVDQVAELLEMDKRQVQRLYASYYNDVTIKMREYDRQEKAADISALIRERRAKRVVEPEPAPVEAEPAAPVTAKDEIWGFRDFLDGRIYLRVTRRQWRAFKAHFQSKGGRTDASYPFDLDPGWQRVIFRIAVDPLNLIALCQDDAIPEAAIVVDVTDLIDAGIVLKEPSAEVMETQPEPEPAPVAEKKTRAPRLPKGPKEAAEEAPVCGPLRVHGYIGECGRTYILQGRSVEISGLAQRFTKEDLRGLSNEILEMARIMERREGASA